MARGAAALPGNSADGSQLRRDAGAIGSSGTTPGQGGRA